MKHKGKVIQNLKRPETVKEIKHCLSLMGYYKTFMPLLRYDKTTDSSLQDKLIINLHRGMPKFF